MAFSVFRFFPLFLAVFFVFPAAPVQALRFTPSPEVAAHPAEEGSLSTDELIHMSLVLSGTSPDQWAPLENRLRTLTETAVTAVKDLPSDYQRAEHLLSFLYKDTLKSYSLLQTRVDRVLQNGSYNCVSSALLYMIAARAAGLDVQAVATTDHAFCLVKLGSQAVDVETTNSYGFDPGTKKEFSGSFGSTTGFAYVPPGNYQNRKAISDRGLLGLLLQNRIVELQKSGRAEEAADLGVDRWFLEKSPAARECLVETMVSYASSLNAKKAYQEGLAYTEEALKLAVGAQELKNLFPIFCNNQASLYIDQHQWDRTMEFTSEALAKGWIGPEDFRKTASIALNNRNAEAVARGDFSQALAYTSLWKTKGYITADQWTASQAQILGSELVWDTQNLPPDQAVKRIEEVYGQGAVSLDRRMELLTYIYGREVQKTAREKGNWEAWQYLVRLPAEVQKQPMIRQALEVYSYNWSVEIHNQFAKLYNSGKKSEALDLLKDSLKKLPGSDLLAKDYKQAGGR